MSEHPTPHSEPHEQSWFEANTALIIRGLVVFAIGLLAWDVALTVQGTKHVHYDFERWFGFYAAAGFVSYVFLVLTAKRLRTLLARPVDYYDPIVEAEASEDEHHGGHA